MHNDYESEELRETPPETPDLTKPITRSLFGKRSFGAIFTWLRTVASALSLNLQCCNFLLRNIMAEEPRVTRFR